MTDETKVPPVLVEYAKNMRSICSQSNIAEHKDEAISETSQPPILTDEAVSASLDVILPSLFPDDAEAGEVCRCRTDVDWIISDVQLDREVSELHATRAVAHAACKALRRVTAEFARVSEKASDEK